MSETPRNPEAPLDEQLSALIDGELDPQAERALRARIAEEPALAERLTALENVDLTLRALPVAQSSAEMGARLRERIARESEPPAGVRLLPFWGGAAIAAAAAAVVWFLLPPATQAPLEGEAAPVVVADTDAREPELTTASEEEIGIALDYETLADLEVIEELELLELMVELEERG